MTFSENRLCFQRARAKRALITQKVMRRRMRNGSQWNHHNLRVSLTLNNSVFRKIVTILQGISLFTPSFSWPKFLAEVSLFWQKSTAFFLNYRCLGPRKYVRLKHKTKLLSSLSYYYYLFAHIAVLEQTQLAMVANTLNPRCFIRSAGKDNEGSGSNMEI